ncbi:MAG: septum formation initiator family protein [Treponema sp.]|nr:septum formation initiator family protein [Treponema sp.]
MKRFRLLSAMLAGTCVYVLISLCGGKDSILASRQLQEQKRILTGKTDEIQRIHDRLNLECTALEKDADVIAAFARKLGFVQDGEKLVKINGLITAADYVYDAGRVSKAVEPFFLPEWFCKLLGVVAFFLVYGLELARDLRVWLFERRRAGAVKGIPVYDLPQI